TPRSRSRIRVELLGWQLHRRGSPVVLDQSMVRIDWRSPDAHIHAEPIVSAMRDDPISLAVTADWDETWSRPLRLVAVLPPTLTADTDSVPESVTQAAGESEHRVIVHAREPGHHKMRWELR